MIRRLKSYLFLLTIAGIFTAFGCNSAEQPQGVDASERISILPAEGLPNAAPLMSGLALDKERITQCMEFEKKKATEGKWPSLIIPEQPIELRADPKNANIDEVDSAVLKFNFNVGDSRSKGCFINALQSNTDGTVTDYATRLMWKQKIYTSVSRAEADTYIRSLNDKKFAGNSDWRLPTTEEMASLVDSYRSTSNSYLDAHFFRKIGANYMTSDTYTYEGFDRVWIVNSFVRSVSISSSKVEPAHVLAVRSL